LLTQLCYVLLKESKSYSIILPMKKKIVFFVALYFFSHLAFAAEDRLTDREKAFLVNLSRQTLYYHLKDGTVPYVDEKVLTDNLKSKKCCFVTLDKKNSGLRGCMGLFESQEQLYKNVIDRTIAAATKDPRFTPVTYDELKDIKLEISVLTEPINLPFSSPEDLMNKLQPLKDGVIITTKYGSSTYLPQVWEQLPDKKDFLSSLCMKHGAPPDYWETNYKDMTVQTYQAIVFGEEVYGTIVVGKKGAVVGEKGAYMLGAVMPLKDGLYSGDNNKVVKGTKLLPGTFVTSDSDIIQNQ